MKRAGMVCMLLGALMLLGGCSGGQEIEDCLFVISMAVDPAEGGNLTVTVKALSGTQEAISPQGGSSGGGSGGASSGAEASGGQQGQGGPVAQSAAESTEPGYVVMSATAKSSLAALNLLGATTPRTVNLSQLQEIVISRTLAETSATLSILKEIYALYEANGGAVVVVTPDHAGDFIRRQYAMFGVRLSQYLQVLFDHFEELGTVPPDANLASVIAAMESGMRDAAAVYAAANDFTATLMLPGDSVTDRLPGHLPRTSPAYNEYLGSAVFSGPRMVGTLTGQETTILRLLLDKAVSTAFALDESMVQVSRRSRVKRGLLWESGMPTLTLDVSMHVILAAGTLSRTDTEIAAQIERETAALISKLQAMGSDLLGYGGLAARRHADIPSWEASGWSDAYRQAQVRSKANLTIR